MRDFEQDIYYLNECKACKVRHKHYLRAKNYNELLTDDESVEIADKSLGEIKLGLKIYQNIAKLLSVNLKTAQDISNE